MIIKWIADVLIPILIALAIAGAWYAVIQCLRDIWPERKTIGK